MTKVIIGQRSAVEQVVLECALETSRVVADLLHTLGHLALVNVEELPAALREEFCACHDTLTREHPLRGEDAVRATVRKMSNQEADDLAARVVRLFAALVREAVREDEPVEHVALATPAVNGAALSAPRKRKSVPQVISLYSAEAQVSRA